MASTPLQVLMWGSATPNRVPNHSGCDECTESLGFENASLVVSTPLLDNERCLEFMIRPVKYFLHGILALRSVQCTALRTTFRLDPPLKSPQTDL